MTNNKTAQRLGSQEEMSMRNASVNSPFSMAEIYRTSAAAASATVLIIVNTTILQGIQAALNQYVSDLEMIEGYAVIVSESMGGSPVDLKARIVAYHTTLSSTSCALAGCVLIGDLPVPLFSGGSPVDLYYMDLNGLWEDTDGDGMFDNHLDGTGDIGADIWLGRLTAGPLGGNETVHLNNYFAKNHRYRIGQLNVANRALAYVDDDWIGKGDYGLSSAYADVTTVNDVALTDAEGYKSRLAENYEFVQLAVHSTAFAHSFKQNYAGNAQVANTELLALNPQPVFYCLDACRAVRYTESNYIGGCYLFSPGRGLAVIGETINANSMDGPSEFYSLFGRGLSLGEAFIQWLNTGGRPNYHMDRTILGDPSLKRRSHYPTPPSPPTNLRIG